MVAEAGKHPILVVDDETEILFSLNALLRRDFEVYTAESGAQALEVLRQRPIHVLMTDQRMPQMTGVELLTRARGECPQAIRIIFTGYADLKAVIDAVNRGEIFRYLTKPWDPDDLCAVLHQACEQYQAIAERPRLLVDLRDHLARQAEREDESSAQTTRALLARIDEALNRHGRFP
jgi:DNA-binding NtrC family response regulator